MFTWTAPPRSKVVLAIESFEPKYIRSPDGPVVEAPSPPLGELMERYGLKRSNTFARLPVADPRGPSLVKEISALQEERVARLRSAWVEEPDPQFDLADWYELHSGTSEWKSAKRARPGQHYGWRDGQQVCSRRFVEVVREHGLTGLEFLPLGDKPYADVDPWFEVYATQPIGRGLDLPLLDSVKHTAKLISGKFELTRRWGEPIVWQSFIREDAHFADPFIRSLLAVSPPYFRIAGKRRFVREHLPMTNFAYTGWGFNRDKGYGFEGRPIRALCCDRSTCDILMRAGLMKKSLLVPLNVVDSSQAQAEILDLTIEGPIPPPVYLPDEAARERSRREALIAHQTVESSLTLRTFAEASEHLKNRLSNGTASWSPAADDPEFVAMTKTRLWKRTPRAWQQVAGLLPLEFEFHDHANSELIGFALAEPRWNDWLSDSEDDRDADERPSQKDLVIARTMWGDWYCVRKGDPLLPDDARVRHWDHETLSVSEEWPNIAAFVSSVIDWCDRAKQA
ncbi:MAG: hypothetical protein KF699_11595 [Phycisphaeraceae bacterium]|nr:hypothetical protein [Phycisphaeraceae bacterium]